MAHPAVRSCALLLAAAAQLPAGAPAPSQVTRLQQALATTRRTLAIQEFMVRKLESLGDAGHSPTFAEELAGYRARAFEARALALALERALRDLCGVEPVRTPPPASSEPPSGEEAAPAPLW